jgi:hypothetical protein
MDYARTTTSSLGIVVINQHIWRRGVSRIGNPTYYPNDELCLKLVG